MFGEWSYGKLETPLGTMVIQDDGYGIARIEWEDVCKTFRGTEHETDFIKQTKVQLQEYFEGHRKVFDLPLRMKGTAFQKEVWHTLTKVPYGETWSYLDVARAIGNEKAVRAVGMANNRNALMIVIPCHRIVGADGKMTSYAGGLERKKALLDLEQQFKNV